MTRLIEILKRWWPVPAFITGSVAAQILLRSDPTPIGHAAGHYSNATVLFSIAPAVAITIWASAPDLRRRPAFWLLNAAIVGAIALVYAANMRIVHAIGAERWTNDQVSTLGPKRPGFEASHVLTERAELASAALVIALAVCLARWHALRPAFLRAAIIASIVVPPWMFPARGIVIIAIGTLHQRAKQLTPQRVDATAPVQVSVRAERA